MTTIVLVDGTNLVNDVGRFLTEAAPSSASPEVQGRYFREWFDIDRLVSATLRLARPWEGLGTIIVHSKKGVGHTPYSVSDREAVAAFWARQGSAQNTSALPVDLPSAGNAEKGVDTTIVVVLFETIDQWESGFLFTNDTDFVPAVWSLRRRGKRIYCASHLDDQSKPLVQACQSFYPLNVDFLKADRDAFEALQPGGPLDAFVSRATPERPAHISIVNGGLVLRSAAFSDGDARVFAETPLARGISVSYDMADRALHLRFGGPQGDHLLVEGIRRNHARALSDAAWVRCVGN